METKTTVKNTKVKATEKRKAPISLNQANTTFAIYLGHRFRIEEEEVEGKILKKKIFNIDGQDIDSFDIRYHLDLKNIFKFYNLLTKIGYDITIKNEVVNIKHKELGVVVKNSEFHDLRFFTDKLFLAMALALSRAMLKMKENRLAETES